MGGHRGAVGGVGGGVRAAVLRRCRAGVFTGGPSRGLPGRPVTALLRGPRGCSSGARHGCSSRRIPRGRSRSGPSWAPPRRARHGYLTGAPVAGPPQAFSWRLVAGVSAAAWHGCCCGGPAWVVPPWLVGGLRGAACGRCVCGGSAWGLCGGFPRVFPPWPVEGVPVAAPLGRSVAAAHRRPVVARPRCSGVGPRGRFRGRPSGVDPQYPSPARPPSGGAARPTPTT